RGTEHPREGAVNGVGCAVGVRMDIHAKVWSLWPMLPALRIDGVSLGFEETHFSKRKGNQPRAVVRLHGHVAPGGVGEFHLAGVRVDNFATECFAAAEVGAEPRLP